MMAETFLVLFDTPIWRRREFGELGSRRDCA
jgi:hypothetical protein